MLINCILNNANVQLLNWNCIVKQIDESIKKLSFH